MNYNAPKIPELSNKKTEDEKFRAVTEYMYAVQKMLQLVLKNLSTDNMTKEVATVVKDAVTAAKGQNKTVSDGDFTSFITQTAQQITQKVIKGEIIAAINLSAGQAKIEAPKIDLSGYTSINEYFRVDENGKFYANAGSVAGFTFEPNKGLYFGSNDAQVSPSLYFGIYDLLKAVIVGGSGERKDWRFKIGANAGFTANGDLYCNAGYFRGNTDAKAIQYGEDNYLSGSALVDNSVTAAKLAASVYGDRIWTNPNPTNDFAAQTVTLDLSAYSAIKIEYASDNVSTAGALYSFIYLMGASTNLSGVYYRMVRRHINITSAGVVFGSGLRYDTYASSTTTTDDGACVPVNIYGIK